MENYMEQVAKMLGVEMGEKFKTLWTDGRDPYNETVYCFKDDGLYDVYADTQAHRILTCLLTGSVVVKHNPWKPEFDGLFWTVFQDGTCAHVNWYDSLDNLNCYKIGNCYRTKEEAKVNRDKWIEFYASDEVLEV